MMTVSVRYSREIDEREVIPHLPWNIYRQGTDRALFVRCRDRAAADLIVADMNAHPGITASIVEQFEVG